MVERTAVNRDVVGSSPTRGADEGTAANIFYFATVPYFFLERSFNRMTLKELEPKNVFGYFAEICNIPHGSDHLEEISNYLVNFAKEHKLAYRQDKAKNVIISKEASDGYENEAGIILQGHMDMVAVHKPELSIDMTREPLKPVVDGDFIYAEGTSLGGDDGIAVAFALAILADDTIAHPHLDVIITTNEETGMDGARAIDISDVKGTRLLNLDSEDEGHFLVGCAGGARVDHIFDLKKVSRSGEAYTCKITGLAGGHSGAEINKERANANRLMGRLLSTLQKKGEISIYALQGGLADNAIPRECEVSFIAGKCKPELIQNTVSEFEKTVQIEFATKDPGVKIVLTQDGEKSEQCMDARALHSLTDALIAMPNGVQAMSADVEGLVQTSLNNGVIKLGKDSVIFVTSVRSSVASEKEALIEQIQTITRLAGGKTQIRGDYPGWAYKKNSPFRDLCLKVYQEMYQKEPIVEAIHAGVECGLLLEKRPDLDCVSIGPDMQNIHTTEEKLNISSTKRVWEYVLKVLAAK